MRSQCYFEHAQVSKHIFYEGSPFSIPNVPVGRQQGSIFVWQPRTAPILTNPTMSRGGLTPSKICPSIQSIRSWYPGVPNKECWSFPSGILHYTVGHYLDKIWHYTVGNYLDKIPGKPKFKSPTDNLTLWQMRCFPFLVLNLDLD